MKELKYKVGDRIFASDNLGTYPNGEWGTVVNIDLYHNIEPYCVKYDKCGCHLWSWEVEKPVKETE